jgi:hypothetical protein
MKIMIFLLFLVYGNFLNSSDFNISYKLGSNTKIISSVKDINPKDFKEGDIIVSLDDGGKISKIVSIKNEEINLEPATIEEAFEKLYVRYFQELDTKNLKTINYYYNGVKNIYDRNSKIFKIKLDNVVLYDYDGDDKTKDDRITADGVIDLFSDIEWKINVDEHSIKELKFINGVNQKSDFKIKISTPVRITIPFSKEFVLADYEFMPVTIGPVVFTPIISLIAGFNVGVAGKVMVNISQSISAKYGAHYINGEWKGITNVNDKSFKGFLNFIGADGWLKGYIGPKLKLNFYNTFGPYIEGFGFLKAKADMLSYKSVKINWGLYGGVEGNVGVSVKIFSFGMKDFEKNIYSHEILINQGSFNFSKERLIKVYSEMDLNDSEISNKIKNISLGF